MTISQLFIGWLILAVIVLPFVLAMFAINKRDDE